MLNSQQQKEIASTILNQLGGNRFIAMTGAKHFGVSLDENSNVYIVFKIGRNSYGRNRIKITLMPSDTYTLEASKMSVSSKTLDVKFTNKKERENVYCDELQNVFTEFTGMYTSL